MPEEAINIRRRAEKIMMRELGIRSKGKLRKLQKLRKRLVKEGKI